MPFNEEDLMALRTVEDDTRNTNSGLGLMLERYAMMREEIILKMKKCSKTDRGDREIWRLLGELTGVDRAIEEPHRILDAAKRRHSDIAGV